MKPPIDFQKVVVITGAGISAESGIATFRDIGGLWQQHNVMELASTEGWRNAPDRVNAFYNERRKIAWQAKPNAAHLALARLEEQYEVVIVTQNVDELHERAGSWRVLHVHGNLAYGRSSLNPDLTVHLGGRPILLAEKAPDGSLLRPDVVWFGETVRYFDEARQHLKTAGKVLIVGTSLDVQPVASLVHHARGRADKVMVSLDLMNRPYGFQIIKGKATDVVPRVVTRWMSRLIC